MEFGSWGSKPMVKLPEKINTDKEQTNETEVENEEEKEAHKCESCVQCNDKVVSYMYFFQTKGQK